VLTTLRTLEATMLVKVTGGTGGTITGGGTTGTGTTGTGTMTAPTGSVLTASKTCLLFC